MRTYIYTMASTALVTYILSAVLNQYQYAWTDWSIIVNGFWNFALIFGIFHFYKKSKHSIIIIDIVFLFLIAFSATDLIHAIFCLSVWLFTDRTINAILIDAFDHYNPLNCLLSILISGISAFLYLLNLPDILHPKK